MAKENKTIVQYDYNWFLGGAHVAATLFVAVLAIEFLDTLGWQDEFFGYIGKWGALIEDGYNVQRDTNTK